MKKACILAPIIACLLVNPSCFAQAANWCGSGTSAAGDRLNPSNFSAGSPTGTTTSIWVTDSLSKYIQTAANTVGSNKAAYPCAAQNEFADFQIHYKNTSGSSVTLNSVTISNLTNPVTGTTISASSGYNILVYAERYYTVNSLSDANGIGTGPIPDPLVPPVEPYHGQTTNAFPITVANGNTQSIWVDILVPSTAPSGYYSGTATITVNGSTLATLPVVLAVWNFSLPSKSTLKNYWGMDTLGPCSGYYGTAGSYSGCSAYPGSGGSVDTAVTLGLLDVAYMLMDHRVSPSSPAYPDIHNGGSWTNYDNNYGPLITGTSTHTILPGAALNILTASQTASSAADIQYIVTHFNSKLPSWLPVLVGYACDEPGTSSSAWSGCASKAAWYDASSPILPTWITTNVQFATSNYGGSSPTPLQYINYMIVQSLCMFPNVENDCVGPAGSSNRSLYNTWLAGGSGSFSTQAGPYVGMYSSCSNHGSCSNGTGGDSNFHYASNMIDATAVRNRAMPWTEYYENVSADEYYDVTYCWVAAFQESAQDCENGLGTLGTDPWVYQYAFGGNGDGTQIYPSYVTGVGSKVGSGVTTPVPLPSVRLKHQRDGMQDYEYMHQLAAAGQSSFVATQLASWFTNDNSFNNTIGIGCSNCLMSARDAMGNKLHQLALSTTAPLPPTNLSVIVQ